MTCCFLPFPDALCCMKEWSESEERFQSLLFDLSILCCISNSGLQSQKEFARIGHHLLHTLPAAVFHAAFLVHLTNINPAGAKIFGATLICSRKNLSAVRDFLAFLHKKVCNLSHCSKYTILHYGVNCSKDYVILV